MSDLAMSTMQKYCKLTAAVFGIFLQNSQLLVYSRSADPNLNIRALNTVNTQYIHHKDSFRHAKHHLDDLLHHLALFYKYSQLQSAWVIPIKKSLRSADCTGKKLAKKLSASCKLSNMPRQSGDDLQILQSSGSLAKSPRASVTLLESIFITISSTSSMVIDIAHDQNLGNAILVHKRVLAGNPSSFLDVLSSCSLTRVSFPTSSSDSRADAPPALSAVPC